MLRLLCIIPTLFLGLAGSLLANICGITSKWEFILCFFPFQKAEIQNYTKIIIIFILRYLTEDCNQITCGLVNIQLYICTHLNAYNLKEKKKTFSILLISPIILGRTEHILFIKTFLLLFYFWGNSSPCKDHLSRATSWRLLHFESTWYYYLLFQEITILRVKD